VRIDLVGTTADFRGFGPRPSLPINHLLGKNRGTAGRIGEVGLSLTIERDSAVWKCHNCEWSGAVSERDESKPGHHRRRQPPSRPTKVPEQASPAALSWLVKRGISEAVARRNRIGSTRIFIPRSRPKPTVFAFRITATGSW
jgi:hypothetical protein